MYRVMMCTKNPEDSSIHRSSVIEIIANALPTHLSPIPPVSLVPSLTGQADGSSSDCRDLCSRESERELVWCVVDRLLESAGMCPCLFRHYHRSSGKCDNNTNSSVNDNFNGRALIFYSLLGYLGRIDAGTGWNFLTILNEEKMNSERSLRAA